jgi:hypothetical protein
MNSLSFFPFEIRVPIILLTMLMSGVNVNAQVDDAENVAGAQKVHISCQFRQTTKISCNDFIRGFFSNYQSVFVEEEFPERADLSLSVMDDVGTGAQTDYYFEWKPKVGQNPWKYSVDQSTLDAAALVRVLSDESIHEVLTRFVIKKITVEDGVLTIVYVAPSSASEQKPDGFFEKLQKSPFYINIGLDGSYRTIGQAPKQTTSMSVNPDLNMIYLKDRYKVDLYVNYKNSMTSVPTSSGENLSANVKSQYFRGILVYTFTDHLSVAVVEHIGADTASNTKLFQNVTGGLEWALVPFRTNENKELTFRIGATQQMLDLNFENQRGNLSEQFTVAFARIYTYWNSADVRTSLRLYGGFEKNLKYTGYEKYNVGATMSYQLNRSTKLSLNALFNYLTKSLTYPAKPDFSNPLMVQQMTGQAGRSLMTSVGIDIVIGNTKKNARDRRWSGETHAHGH